jgi:hypothetical protein
MRLGVYGSQSRHGSTQAAFSRRAGFSGFKVSRCHGIALSLQSFSFFRRSLVCCPGNSMMRPLGVWAPTKARAKRLYRFGYNADRHPKDCGPKGCAENSPTPALLLSCDAQRHRALVAPWRRAVLSAMRIMLFPGQHTRASPPHIMLFLGRRRFCSRGTKLRTIGATSNATRKNFINLMQDRLSSG